MSDLRSSEIERLKQKLKKHYPEYAENDPKWVDKMAEALYDHDEDTKLPMTSEMVEYFQADRIEKDAKAKKDGLKAKLVEQMKDLDHPNSGIKLGRQKRFNYHDEVFYSWVESNYPQYVDLVTVKTVDKGKYGELLAKRLVTVPSAECYDDESSDTLTCQHPKVKK